MEREKKESPGTAVAAGAMEFILYFFVSLLLLLLLY